ncbi:Uncharacterised protein [Neisseria animaloris]|uniref:Uncharacterized protein n=1 Tax=Neisseria animaloris TaxID=326522 RepID=A0A3S5F6E6_9NEIS|nr:Uncharacterised protein [Neisseria animaloris]
MFSDGLFNTAAPAYNGLLYSSALFILRNKAPFSIAYLMKNVSQIKNIQSLTNLNYSPNISRLVLIRLDTTGIAN